MRAERTGSLLRHGGVGVWGVMFAVAFALICLLLAGGGLPRWQGSAFLHALALAALAGLGSSWIVRGRSSGTSPQSDPGLSAQPGRMHTAAAASLVLLLAILLASSLLAEYPGPAIRRLSAWFCLAAWVCLVARTAGTVERLRRWTAALALFGALGSTLALAASWVRDQEVMTFPFVNPNYNGALAVAALPLAAVLALSAHSRGERIGWLLCLVPLLGSAFQSHSTAAQVSLLATLLTLLLGLAAWWRAGRGDAAAGATAALLILMALGLPVLLGRTTLGERTGVVGVAHVDPGVRDDPGIAYKLHPGTHWKRLQSLMTGRPDVAIANRLRFARSTVLALAGEPLLGYGPGSVPLTFARYRLQVPGASRWGEAVGQLHAIGLQRVYECGLAGLAGFSVWLLSSVLGRPSADPHRAWLRVGLAGALAALVVAGAADALETVPALAVFGFVVLALLAARQEARGRERLPRWALVAAGAAVLVMSLAIAADWLRADLAQRRAEQAVKRVNASGTIDDEVYGDLRRAAELDPVVGLYAHQAAYAAEELGLESLRRGDRAAGSALLEEAERLHVDVVRKFPDVYGLASQAGNFLLDRDRPAEAVPYLRKAVALDYYAPLGHFYLGEAYRLAGREAEAIESHARAIRFYPAMARAAMWSAPELAPLRVQVLQRVRRMLLEESASHPPDSASGSVLEYVDQLLGNPGAVNSTQEPIVLAHKLDEIPARSRSRHIFARQGFTMINLPVRVIPEKAQTIDEERWSHVVDGLPPLTAAELEHRGDWEAAPWRLRKETEPRPAKRPPHKASAASGREGVET